MSDELLKLTGAILRARQAKPDMKKLGFPEPHPGQMRALALLDPSEVNSGRFVVANWGRRAGKSEMALRWLGLGATGGEACAYIVPTYAHLTGPEGAWTRLKNRLHPLAERVSEQEHSIYLRTGGSIECWSTENGADRIRGRKYHRVVLDEAASMGSLGGAWSDVIAPTLIDYEGKALFVSTPRRGGTFQEFYNRGGVGEWRALTITSLENPHLPEGSVPRTLGEALEMGMTEQSWRQEIMADFEAAPTELVFPEFDARVHVGEPPVEWEAANLRGAGGDMGGGDPNAWYKVGRVWMPGPRQDSVANRERLSRHLYIVYDEYYETGAMSMRDVSQTVAPWHLEAPLWGIAIGESKSSPEIRDLQQIGWTQQGVNVISAKGNPQARYGVLSSLLRENRLLISPKCERLIESLYRFRRVYRRNPATGESYLSDETDHQYSHAPDAVGHIVQPMLQATPMRDGSVKRELNFYKPPGRRGKLFQPSTWGELVKGR